MSPGYTLCAWEYVLYLNVLNNWGVWAGVVVVVVVCVCVIRKTRSYLPSLPMQTASGSTSL